MKRGLFNLFLSLAMVVFACGSALAQGPTFSTDDTNNNSNNRYIMVAGATHTFSIVKAKAANVVAWSVWTDVTTPVDVTSTEDNVAASSTLDDGVGTAASFQLTWARSAFGAYYIQVVETDNDNGAGCATTTRRFYVTIIDFDIYVYASDASGAPLTGTTLIACGEGTTANYGDVEVGDTKVAFSNNFNTNDPEVSNDLVDYTGEDPRTNRYVSMQIIWHTGNDFASVPEVSSLKFDYTASLSAVSGTYTENTDLFSVNGKESDAGGRTGDVAAVRAPTSSDPIATIFGSTVAGGVATIPVVINDRWNSSTTFEDLNFYLNAKNVTLYSSIDATTGLIGTEPVSYETTTTEDKAVTQASNISATQTIQLAPATSTISVD